MNPIVVAKIKKYDDGSFSLVAEDGLIKHIRQEDVAILKKWMDF